jgi:hypothetical protein
MISNFWYNKKGGSMSHTITLPEDLDSWLQKQANRLGISVENLIKYTIEERWSAASRAPSLSQRESELLLEIQTIFSEEETEEFHALCRLHDAELLTSAEHVRYRELIHLREKQNAVRLRALGELAKIRGISLDEIIADLHLEPKVI